MPIRGVWPVAIMLVCALLAAPAAAQSDTQRGAMTPENFTLDNLLTFDPSAPAVAPAKRLRLPGYFDSPTVDVSRADRPDGSSSFTVKKPLLIDVDTKLGADLAPAAPSTFLPAPPAPGGLDSGAAWASVGVANFASLDARVDPNNDQGKIGTTLQHAMPIGSKLSVTIQDMLSVTDTLSTRTATSAGLPLSSPAPTQVWGNENKVKFDILPTGTSFSAGVATSSIDPVTHNRFSAEQRLYGPLHVTTAINDVGEPTSNKSITAGVKLNW